LLEFIFIELLNKLAPFTIIPPKICRAPVIVEVAVFVLDIVTIPLKLGFEITERIPPDVLVFVPEILIT